ncbi:MAG: hypothetical protein JNM39_15990 [Bdellovibrionaceae bacterium]|nr:hypothetical protein [Pseudobdellovibrionaceae bacterium]
MKKIFVIIGLVSISFAANAGYWRCEGKNVVVGFSHGENGTLLSATAKGSEIPSNVFLGDVTMEGIAFKGSGRAMKNVSAVFANDRFGTYQAGLNIKLGDFYVEEEATAKIVYNASDLKCEYSDGE